MVAKAMNFIDRLLETGAIPDPLLRIGIRRTIAQRLAEEDAGSETANREKHEAYIAMLRESPLAVHTADANAQHYEVPTDFFRLVLGPRLKYSCAYWPEGVTDLGAAEEAMLALTGERAQLADGQTILELGCGWGSLTLWMAERFPRAEIVAVSNSVTQKQWIDAQCSARGFRNVTVQTCDMREFGTDRRFDRVVSVEMFEHMRNYGELLRRIRGWMKPEARLFVHIFSHARFAYLFEDRGPGDWMARHFFTGGQMPSDDLLLRFDDDLVAEEHWTLGGTHYEKTAEAWLARMDARESAVRAIFARTYGPRDAERFFNYWRIFFMSCAEVWGYRGGREWLVSHYRFRAR
ncbi:MAG TPA: cyclopropane-fatty-acyl-phospholipid synthase family protein [Thermoanaerobaculia bacterium]|nr:cyclopropane-fatty-acyl-phospholipid synthase family protein [Thermoanaerobaculia bacterium]